GGAATPAAGTPAAGGEAGRGIILTLAGTTPFGQPAALLNQSVINSLLAIGKNTYPDGHPFYVAKAEVVHLVPLASDNTKLQKIQTDYQAALQAKQSGTTITTPGFTPTNTGG